MRRSLTVSSLAVALALTGCPGPPATNDAASPGNDAGHDAAASTVDGGNDAATSTVDGGHDAAASTPDANADANVDANTAPMMCAANFAGCTTLEDHRTDTAPVAVTVMVDTALLNHYSPNCIRIHAGQMVTLPGGAGHPLHAATCSPSGTPINTTAGGTFTFATAGNYGYYCSFHGGDTGTGMAGLIVVE